MMWKPYWPKEKTSAALIDSKSSSSWREGKSISNTEKWFPSPEISPLLNNELESDIHDP